MGQQNQKIVICENHDHYPTPLIETFKFPGAENWCPYCGAATGMFDGGVDVVATAELVARKEAYKKKAYRFLRDQGHCVAWPEGVEVEKM